MSATTARGKWGERLAALDYLRDGYRVLERNWSCRHGEIDLILARADVIVFCEVKTRARNSHGGPTAAVGPAKQRRLRRSAEEWIWVRRPGVGSFRFDVVAIVGVSIERFEAAF